MEKQQQEDNIPAVAMNINLPTTTNEGGELVKGEQIASLCQSVLGDINSEKEEITHALDNFVEMVFNAGDATSASKEALVNLLKLRSDLVDKKTRVMEMMMRAYNREGPKNVTATQHNDIYINDNKRKLFQELDSKEKQNDDEEKGKGDKAPGG